MRNFLVNLKINILLFLGPILRLLPLIGRSETLMDSKTVKSLVSQISPGDILLSHEKQRLTSIFIKGFYDHAVIVSNRGTVIEAVGDNIVDGVNLGGVREVDLIEWLYKKDYVAVVRTNLDPFIVARSSENSLQYIGYGYDYTFSHKNLLIYCSELVYLCYVKEWPNFLKEIPEDREILPQMYLDLCKEVSYLRCIADTKK